MAASITPPDAPKMAPAPLYSLISGSSNADGSSAARSTPSRRSRRANSRMVSTTSTSGTPLRPSCGRAASCFFAVQGMTDTTRTRAGSMPMRVGSQLLASEPRQACGERVDDIIGRMSGWCFSA